MESDEMKECRNQLAKLDEALEVFADCDVEDISVSRISAFDEDIFEGDDDEDSEGDDSTWFDDEEPEEAFARAVDTIVDVAKYTPKLLAAVDAKEAELRQLKSDIRALAASIRGNVPHGDAGRWARDLESMAR